MRKLLQFAELALLLCPLVAASARAQTLTAVNVTPFGSVLQSGTEQFSATCLYSNGTTDNCAGKTVTWTSSQPSLVTVNSSGLATYVTNCGSGAYPDPNGAWECWAHIVATVNGFSDYATVYVQYPSDTFQVMLTPGIPNNPTRTPTLAIGATATFGAGDGIDGSIAAEGSANPFPGCDWTSSNTAVGTINRYGFFTALSAGTSNVVCTTAGNGSYSDAGGGNVPTQGVPAAFTITVVAGGTSNTTWYVRPDGGTPYTNATDTPAGQCNGQANAAYPGSGVNQACAFGDFEYLYFDQTTEKQQWVISGGDTVIVYPKTGGYDTAYTGASTPSNCLGDAPYCDVPAPPSGTAARATRILGSNYASCTGSYGPNPAMTTLLLGWGREVARLDNSQFVDMECFEFASNSSANGYEVGVVTSALTSYATFKNLFIHGSNGLTNSGGSGRGENGATGLGVVWDHVHIRAARMTGFDMDDAPYSVSNISVAGGLTMTNSNIEFTGCEEIYGSSIEYPYVANECIDQNTGGQGDAFGTGAMTGNWYFANDIFRYNFQDGLDNLHSGAQSETVINSQSYGNLGNQYKFGDVATMLFQNNFLITNCNRLAQPFNGVSIAMSGVGFCRAGGQGLVTEWSGTGSYLIQNNTFIGIGIAAILYQCETTWANCSAASTVLQNNIFAGYTGSNALYNSGGVGDVFYQSTGSPVPANLGWATRTNNDFYNVQNYTPLLTAEIQLDPKFIGEPPFATELTDSTESVLDNYNFMPASNSPMLGAGINVGIATDANGVSTTTPPVLGALNYYAPVAAPTNLSGTFILSGKVNIQ